MQKIDKLLLKAREMFCQGDEVLSFAAAVPACIWEELSEGDPNFDKFVVAASVVRPGEPGGGRHLEPVYFDTQQEALDAAMQLKERYAPQSNTVKKKWNPAILTFQETEGAEKRI